MMSGSYSTKLIGLDRSSASRILLCSINSLIFTEYSNNRKGRRNPHSNDPGSRFKLGNNCSRLALDNKAAHFFENCEEAPNRLATLLSDSPIANFQLTWPVHASAKLIPKGVIQTKL